MNKKNCKNQIEYNKIREADEEITEMTESTKLARLREETNAIREATKIEEEKFEKKSELLKELADLIEMLEHRKRPSPSLRNSLRLYKILELIEKCDAHFRSVYEYLDRKM